MAVLTLRLDEQTDRKLQELAKESEHPKSYFIKKALYEDCQLAMARRADRDDEILTLAQVRKALGVLQ